MTRPAIRLGPTLRRLSISTAAAALLPSASPAAARAQQQVTVRDTLHLGALQAGAVSRDPRRGQLELLAAQTALRLRSLDAERLPTFIIDAQGQYQSDVATIPLQLPGGATVPAPPHDSYDAHLAARQPIHDPTRGPRRELERARLAESEARVRSSLFAVRQGVNDAFFGALRLEAQRAEVAAGIAGLEAQLGTARDRVREGAALPGEAAALEAERLRRRQSLDELASGRDAALDVLAELTGVRATSVDRLALPDLGAEVARVRAALDGLRARPEYEQFARSRDVLERQRETVAARDRPRLSAFARAGYGRPGLDPLGREFDEYWLAGVQVEWTPWSWGTTGRERAELAIRQRIVNTEEAAFTESVRRGVANDIAMIDRLERSLAADDEIVALRAGVLDETRLRFAEGVATSAEYVGRETELLAARLARATHRVELVQARAHLLTLLGVEVR